jgi:hypothetical protein
MRWQVRNKEGVAVAEQDSKILELAYDAGVAMLKQQEEALTKYRDRALQLLTAATIATSLLGGLSQFSQKSGTGFITRDVAAVVFIAVGALIALNTLITVWKSSKWDAPPGPSLFYCDFYETRKSEQEARVGAVQKMMTIIEDRNAALKPRRIGGRFAAALLLADIAVVGAFLAG